MTETQHSMVAADRSSASVAVGWDVKTVIAYALAAGSRPDEDLEHVYEGAGPAVLPSLASALSVRWLPTVNQKLREMWGPLVLRTQRWTLLRPLAVAGQGRCDWRIASTTATERGAEMVVDATLTVDDVPAARSRSTLISRARPPGLAQKEPAATRWLDRPAHPPTTRRTVAVSPQQTAIFRLTLDLNPDRRASDALHIDPSVAQEAGFAAPPLHGPAVEGLLFRAALTAGLPATTPVAMRTEFRRPIAAGAQVEVTVWREPAGAFVVETTDPTAERLAIARVTPGADDPKGE